MSKVKTYKDKSGAYVFKSGEKYPAWLLMALPILSILPVLIKKTWKRTNKQSAFLTIILFYITMAFVERWAVTHKWWSYNIQRDFFSMFGIPITELIIYYIYPIIFTIALFEFFKKWFFDFFAFILVIFVNVPLTILFEYLGVDVFEIWGFDCTYNELFGITLFSYPIEEFIFWWGAPILVLSTYKFFSCFQQEP